MRAVWEEVRRAFRLAYIEGPRAMMRGERPQRDPHYFRGFLAALPIFVVWVPIALWLSHDPLPRVGVRFLLWMLPGSLVMNFVLFAVAARSRAKG